MSVVPSPALAPSPAASPFERLSRLTHALRGDSLKALALRGSLWTFGAYGASQVLRLASSLILTRLLFKEAFGLMALVNVFMSGLQMFSDIGIGPAIIQSKREDATFLNTAWTLQIIRGFFLTTCTCLIAYPVAKYYGQPQLMGLLPVVGLTALINSFQTTALFTIDRRMDVKRVMLLQLLGQLVNLVVLIALAYLYRSVWSLAFAGVISTLIMVVVGYQWIPSNHSHRLCFDAATRHELLSFGRWIFLSTVLTFLAGQSDRLIMGKLVDPGTLGVYSVALMIAALPTTLIIKVSGSVVFPAYARLARTPRPGLNLPDGAALDVLDSQLPSRLHRVRTPLLLLGSAIAAGLIAGGGWLVPGLYRTPYWAAGWMLQILAVGAIFQFMEQTLGSALLAMGKSKDIATGNFVKLACLITLVPLGYHFRGILGVLIAISVGDALKYLTLATLAHRSTLNTFRADSALIALTVLAAVLAWLPGHFLHGPYLLRAALAMLIACSIVGATTLLYRHSTRLPAPIP